MSALRIGRLQLWSSSSSPSVVIVITPSQSSSPSLSSSSSSSSSSLLSSSPPPRHPGSTIFETLKKKSSFPLCHVKSLQLKRSSEPTIVVQMSHAAALLICYNWEECSSISMIKSSLSRRLSLFVSDSKV